MTTIIPITFRQRTDIYQIVRFQYNERRRIGTILILLDIQQIQLGMLPKVGHPFRKLFVHSQHIITNPPRFIRDFINGVNIKELLISIFKTDTKPTGKYNFLPFHRSFLHLLRENVFQFFRYGSRKDTGISIGHRTKIPQEFLSNRFFPMIHHLVTSQSERMQGIRHGMVERELCGHIVDTGSQVRGLQTDILHLLADDTFKRSTQGTVSMQQRTLLIYTKRP